MCAWHIEQKLKKKVLHLNKGSNPETKALYKKIINIPYCEYEDDYSKKYQEIIESTLLNENFIKYFKEINENKNLWVKCFIKQNFTCGMATSSRIEAKHRVIKKFLDGNSRLGEIYACFQELEQQEINSFKEEIQKVSRKEEDSLTKHSLIQKSQELILIMLLEF